LVTSVLRLLTFVDELPPGATGVLKFGAHGVILVESRKICWAMTRSMRFTLTDILRHQSTPPVPREAVEEVYRRCQRTGKPVGEALLEGGLVTAPGLKAAVLRHTGEALATLAQTATLPDGFVNHPRAGYDPKFSFTACELLAMFGARDDPARAAAAQGELGASLVHGSVGAAFIRSNEGAGTQLIAVDPGCDLPVTDLSDVCNWVSGLFDVASTFDSETHAARATWGDNMSLVSWRAKEVGYVGVCSSRAAAACLLSNIAERSIRTSGVVRTAPRSKDGAT
jgi:hypothetical protein